MKFIPILLNNPLVSCSLTNFNFVPSNTVHFDKSIILQFFVLTAFRLLLSLFFYTLDNKIILFYIYSLNFHFLL